MAKKKTPPPLPYLCPVCTQLCQYRNDKHGRPYTTCSACGSRVFLKMIVAQVGYQVMNDFIHANIDLIQPEIQRRFREAVLKEQRDTITANMHGSPEAKRKAVQKNNGYFFPTPPGQEEQAWAEAIDEVFSPFLKGA